MFRDGPTMPALNVLTVTTLAIGVFYMLGGVVVLRQLVMDSVLDKALAMLGSKSAGKEQLATRILTLGAMLTFASGLSLMALSHRAPWIFGANLAVQAGYLVWAARHIPPEDEASQRGRSATIRAFYIYAAMTAFVVYAGAQGIWRQWIFAGAGILPALTELGIFALCTASVTWLMFRPVRKSGWDKSPALDDDHPDDVLPPPIPTHLRLAPEFRCSPTWDDETGLNIDPANLSISDELAALIDRWDTRLQSAYRDDKPVGTLFDSIEEERLWAEEGRQVAAQLAEEWQGSLTVRLSALSFIVANARHDLSPYDTPDDERVSHAALCCGLFEIEEILRRLDQSARDRAALPAWDGDSLDDVAQMQSFYARLLSGVDPRYRDDIARGLESDEEETRTWVRLALDGQAG